MSYIFVVPFWMARARSSDDVRAMGVERAQGKGDDALPHERVRLRALVEGGLPACAGQRRRYQVARLC